ncbi:MAG: glutamate mutase L, partial [Anaerolineales bacterium]
MLREAGPPTSTDTVLAVDFGSANTRALLFDVVGSVYRFVGYGEAPSTINAPYRDASEGMRHALDQLQASTGRKLLDDSAHLIMPATTAGRGADTFVATASGGPAVRGLLVGLLPDVSLESVRRLASSSYLNVLDSFSLGDLRGEVEQIDAVIAARPELLVIAGGSDGGASDALLKLVETISLACHLLPPGSKTRALFAGNEAVAPRLSGLLGGVATVSTAANVQPELGREQLGAARTELGRIYEEIRLEQIGGFAQLAQWSSGRITPTAQAEGHFIRFLSQLPAWPQGVLGVDVGAGNTSVAAAWRGELNLNVQAGLGLGEGAGHVLETGALELVTRWLPEPISDNDVRDFIYNKAARPHTVPAEPQDLYLELALARQVMRTALAAARPDWPETAPGSRGELLPAFSLLLGGGAVLGRAPRPGLAALLLLDALQPAGVTRLMLDPYHLAPALGAA